MEKEENIQEETLKPILLEDLGYILLKETNKDKIRAGLYRCMLCDKEFKAAIYNVKKGITKSCGCIKSQRIKEANTKHNIWSINKRLYMIFTSIKDRVLNPKYINYKDYGGRGIIICDEWIKDIKAFYKWAMENGYEEHLTIDRIDNDGNYCPENCRWTTKTIQRRNTRIAKNNTSGFKGVSYNKKANKYKAQTKVNNKSIYLGSFPTAVEGAIAYNNYIIENNLEGFILNEIEI